MSALLAAICRRRRRTSTGPVTPTVLFRDTFTSATEVNIQDHTPDLGDPWSMADFGTSTGQQIVTTDGTATDDDGNAVNTTYLPDLGILNGTFQAFDATRTDADLVLFGVHIRSTDSAAGYGFGYLRDDAGTVFGEVIKGWIVWNLATTTLLHYEADATVPTGPSDWQLVVSGTTGTLTVDGVQKLQYTELPTDTDRTRQGVVMLNLSGAAPKMAMSEFVVLSA